MWVNVASEVTLDRLTDFVSGFFRLGGVSGAILAVVAIFFVVWVGRSIWRMLPG